MTVAVARPESTSRARSGHSRRRTPYILIAPAAALMAVFLLYPIGSVVYFSLQRYNVTQPWDNGFVGLENFSTLLFHDSLFWSSLGFTAKWVIVEVSLQLVFGLGLALLVNETFVARGFARALVFSPWAVSGVLTTGIWVLLYNPTTGIFRYLADAGIGHQGTAVLAQPGTVFPAVIVTELWRGVPFFAILLLADLQSISRELYAAASVDGAGRLQRFRYITMPHIRDVVILATLLRAVWEFNNVDLLYTLTGGGPAQQTTTLPLYVAQKAIESHDFGYGAALTVVAFTILLFFSVLYLRVSKFGRDVE